LDTFLRKQEDSHLWKVLLSVKDQFLSLGYFRLKDRPQIRFWKDKWLSNEPLNLKYPALFNIARRKHDTVANILHTTPLNVSFTRALLGNNLENWNRIVSLLAILNLQEDRDMFIWSLQSSGLFSVRSMYPALVMGSECLKNFGVLNFQPRLKSSCGI
jgi:hypothetical protein